MIPDDWEVLELQEVTERFIGGGTPSTENPAYWNGDIPWMRGAWISDIYIQEGEKMITKEGLENSSTNLVPANNVLVATRVSIGNIAVNKIDIAISQDLTGVVIDTSKADISYIFWALKAKANQLVRLNQGTAIKGILRKDLRKLKVALPTLEEQKRISEIIGRVDEISQVTRHLVGSCMSIKKSLMQHLLTRGIGHTKFKKTKIGRIPEHWNLLNLSQVADIIMGQSPPSSTYNDSGVGLPFYQGKTDFGFRVPFVRMYCSQPSRAAKGGDILLSVRAPVGGVNITEKRCAIGRGIAAVRTVSLFNEFLFQYLRSSGKYWTRVEQGSTFKAINKRDLENLPVPVPPEDEQQRIADILFSVDAKILLERRYRETLVHLKNGLMQVLLTGKVRVRA